MVKTIIMTGVRATGPGAGPSMLNIGAADIVRGHMVVHDLGAASERVGGSVFTVRPPGGEDEVIEPVYRFADERIAL